MPGHTDPVELSPLARRFAEEYLIDFKAGPAALRAGFQTASPGYALIHDPRVQALINEGKRKASERINISVDSTLESFRIMRDVTAADFFYMAEVMAELPSGMPGVAPQFVGTGRFYMALKPLEEWTDEMRHALKSVKHGPNGPEIVLHDKLAANVHIGKYLKMFVDQTDITSGGKSLGEDLVTATMSPKEAAEAYQSTLKAGK